jgi:hypothetical protein
MSSHYAMRIFTFFGLLVASPAVGATIGVDVASPSGADVLWVSEIDIVGTDDWDDDGPVG